MHAGNPTQSDADDRVLQTFDEEKNAWNMTKGEYEVMVGGSSDDTPLLASFMVH